MFYSGDYLEKLKEAAGPIDIYVISEDDDEEILLNDVVEIPGVIVSGTLYYPESTASVATDYVLDELGTISFSTEIELYDAIREVKSLSVRDFMNESLAPFSDEESVYDTYLAYGENDQAFIEGTGFDVDRYLQCYGNYINHDEPIKGALGVYNWISESADEMLKIMDEHFQFRNKYEREVVMNSPNGDDLLGIKNYVPITKELEGVTHFTHDDYADRDDNSNLEYLSYVVDCYKENPSLFFDVLCNDGNDFPRNHQDNRECDWEELSAWSLPDTDHTEEGYYSDVYHRLHDMFEDKYHFVPKVLPQLECGLTRLYGRDISDETLQNFTDNFNRKAVALVKDTYNPTLITLVALNKINPGNITSEQKEILTTYMDRNYIKDYYHISDILNQSSRNGRLDDYINVVKHADVAYQYQQSVQGYHDVTFTEASQEINNNWMEREKEKFEKKYGYRFEDNRVDIPGSDKMVEMNGLRAYILPADDLRNFTVGYDTDCCQHYGGAGESCVVAATSRPNAGIFVIEKDDKIEAQAFVWTTGHIKDGDFVLDSLTFDNIEFSNDQNLNKHGLVMKAYDDGISQNEYRAIKKTMDYEGILAAYVKELPYKNVYMGTNYNEMSSIGKPLTDMCNNKAFHGGFSDDAKAATSEMVEAAIGDTYTDFDETARILKADGEMCMEMQKEVEIKDGRYVSNGHEKEYDISAVDELFEKNAGIDDVIAECESLYTEPEGSFIDEPER